VEIRDVRRVRVLESRKRGEAALGASVVGLFGRVPQALPGPAGGLSADLAGRAAQHQEFLGELELCLTPGSVAYDNPLCEGYRRGEQAQVVQFGVRLADENPTRFPELGDGREVERAVEAERPWGAGGRGERHGYPPREAEGVLRGGACSIRVGVERAK
jgi:hypothetical protein